MYKEQAEKMWKQNLFFHFFVDIFKVNDEKSRIRIH
jgi:hypothetical protein